MNAREKSIAVGSCLVGIATLIAALGAAAAEDKPTANKAAADKPATDEPKPIAIAEVKRDAPVNFQREVLPILSKSCLACHSATKAENNLVLETPQTILKGGDAGSAVVPQNAAESLLLQAAAHQAEPTMPPDDNNVAHKPLTPEELGLVKLWINQGATGEVTRGATPVKWQPLPPGINPIYAVSVTADGEYAACGRANQIFVYHLPSGRLVARLTDPELLKTGLYQNQGVAHLDLVQSLSFSPDGQWLASGAYREVKLWRRPHNARKAQWTSTPEPARTVATSPDGKWVATGDAKGTITLWDLASGKPSRTLAGHEGAVTALRFVDPEKLASASFDKSIRVWNLADGTAVARIDASAPLGALALLADGRRIAAGGADGLVRVSTVPGAPMPDLASNASSAAAASTGTESTATPPTTTAAPSGGAPTAAASEGGVTLTCHKGPVTALAASQSDPNVLFSAGDDRTIRRWDLARGQQTWQIDHGGPVAALAIRGDGQQLASAGGISSVRLWKAEDGQPWVAPNNQPTSELKGDSRAQWRVTAAQLVAGLAAADLARTQAVKDDVEAKIVGRSENVKTTAAAEKLAAKTLEEKTVAAKTAVTAKQAADKEFAAAKAATETAQQQAARAKEVADKEPQNADLAKASQEAVKAAGEAEEKRSEAEKIAQAAASAAERTKTEVMTAESLNMNAEQAATDAAMDIKAVVDALPGARAAVKAGEIALAGTQARLAEIKNQAAALEKPFCALAYSPDQGQLAAGGDNPWVRTFSSENGAGIDTFEGHQAAIAGVAFTPAGDLVSIGVDGSGILWDTRPAWTLERTIGNVDDPSILVDRVLALAFSPDGKLLASGSGEPSRSGELKLWNVADGTLARAITPAHSDTVFGLEFSPDGAHLASSAADRFVKVFDVQSGSLAKAFEGHTHHVLDVTWRADGRVLASGGADNVIKFWDFTTGDQQRTTAPVAKEITSVAFVGISHQLIAGCGDRTVRLYNSDNGNVERNFTGAKDFIYAAALSADGRFVVAGGQDSMLFEWSVENAQVMRSLEPPQPATETGTTGR